ncbi:MAG: hypothetical protein ACYDHN_01720 [Solirubrobacteraceae bacterium]
MSNAVVVKQGQPSAPGTVVDTSAAKVVPTSSEVRTEAAAREVAAQGKASREKIGELAKGMTHPVRAKDEAVRATTGKGKKPSKAKPAAKPAAKARGAGNGSGPVAKLTTEWLSTKKRDVKVKDEVKLPNGAVITIIGRWTRRAKDGSLTPMVTGHIVLGAPDGKKKGDRHNAVAAEVTHIGK